MSLRWQKHPYLTPPTDAEIAVMEPEQLIELHQTYHSAIENAEKDPIKYGFELEPWKDADRLLQEYDTLLVFGGNRSSKTRFGARTANKAATMNPGANIYCLGQDEAQSIETQQKAVYEWLPANLKSNMKSETA